jgi:hypothetical protein
MKIERLFQARISNKITPVPLQRESFSQNIESRPQNGSIILPKDLMLVDTYLLNGFHYFEILFCDIIKIP